MEYKIDVRVDVRGLFNRKPRWYTVVWVLFGHTWLADPPPGFCDSRKKAIEAAKRHILWKEKDGWGENWGDDVIDFETEEPQQSF